MNLKPTNFDFSWTLFLDRDGVINKKIENDYVKNWDNFQFIEGVLPALKIFNQKFQRILIVTNQQGIGKGLFTEEDLERVHQCMLEEINNTGGRIDEIYFCPALSASNSLYRKPNTGMALAAKNKFPEIDFTKSLMVGDSISDMEFGKNVGMKTVYISATKKENSQPNLIDWEFKSLKKLADHLV